MPIPTENATKSGVTAGETDIACQNLRWSWALLAGLVDAGVAQLVLSPGARSTPLVLAAQALPGVVLTPILDERSAAFFAVGLARSARRPVALLCTSGSAAGHWLPAVIEASEWGLPLVLLSADRPPHLRGWGANQTVDQVRLFGTFAREFHDPGPPQTGPEALKAMRALGRRAVSDALGPRPGPVHINLPFPEPLVPGCDCDASADQPEPIPWADTGRRRESIVDLAWLAPLLRGRGLICCGPGDLDVAARDLWDCARELRLPVLTDPLSGLRFGDIVPERVARYDTLLRNPDAAAALRPDWVLKFGASPVSKTLGVWLTGVPTLLVDPAGRWADPTHDARAHIVGDVGAFCRRLTQSGLVQPDQAWCDLWIGVEARTAVLATEHLAATPWCEAQMIAHLIATVPAGEGLFCANSLPIRQLDAWSGSRDAALAVFGNRGASGIDGQPSTLAGLNAGGTQTWGLLGDLSLVHDLSGLFLASRLSRPLIVINNGGGRIFDYLPQGGLSGVEGLWRTPQNLDLKYLARLFGLDHVRVDDGAGFRQALADSSTDPLLIEVRINAELSRAQHLSFWQRIAEARELTNNPERKSDSNGPEEHRSGAH